jgi:hypothetical protein
MTKIVRRLNRFNMPVNAFSQIYLKRIKIAILHCIHYYSHSLKLCEDAGSLFGDINLIVSC